MDDEKRNESPEQDRKAYDKSVVKAATLKYFKKDELATDVWMNKYALRDEKNIYEKTPDDMHHRLASEFARIEAKYPNPLSEDEIYDLLKDFRYIVPQGSPMFGIGNNSQIVSLSNCFVIGTDSKADSYGAIMRMDEEQVQLMKRRGGVGHDMSMIRPKNTKVLNSALTSTGVVSFMERYSNTTKEVAQGGRRGALMLSLSIKHPDAEEFIDAKLDTDKITGANISVRIDDEFMKCVEEDREYIQKFPIDSDNPIVEIPINAKKLWEKIIHNAWKSAEPGILFWDTIERESVPDCYADGWGFKTVSTNPCGEIPLCAYDSCRLTAMNLYSYVEKPFTADAYFNWDRFDDHVMKAQRLMDDLIDLEIEKIDQVLAKIEKDPESDDLKHVEKNLWVNIKAMCLNGRRTGLGITAEGDMLAALGYRYGSDEATDFSVEVHKALATAAYKSSIDMAEERGAFRAYESEREMNNPFVMRMKESLGAEYTEKMMKSGRRNIALLTIAPTGSVSICTQTTSGIEPVFRVAYRRRRKVNPNDGEAKATWVDNNGQTWEEYNVIHPKFLVWAEVNGYDPEKIVNEYQPKDIDALIEKSPYANATSDCIDWVNKVRMQGAVQKWVDHSISVTVNIPKETTEEVVSDIYMTAWKCGCKGMTIYRDGSRNGVLVTNKDDDADFKDYKAPNRPKKLECDIIRFNNDKEKWIAFVGLLDGRPYEIFSGKAEKFVVPLSVEHGWIVRVKEDKDKPSRYDFKYLDSDGYCTTIEGLSRTFNKEFWNYAKLISGILRQGMPIPKVIDLISKLNFDSDSINTWKNGIVRALKKHIKDGTNTGEKCPQCGSELIFTSGCKECPNCGWSKCGG